MGETERLPASAVLMAISKHIAIRCRDQNKAFMDCKKLDRNPEKCLAEGDAVTSCAVGILKDLNQKCPEQLKTFHECMDYFSHDFRKCQTEQKAFEEMCPP
ncbi:hypothetical protein BSKO_13127 [Bryopsis sp. KO-2023]|nr:hypothetical protein BSKO_13127 [Bryopsis sp. KO-2023]